MNVLPGSPAVRVLQAGEILTVTADAVSSGRIGQLGDKPGDNTPDVPSAWSALAATKTLRWGPYPHVTRFLVEALVGQGVSFTQSKPEPTHIEIAGTVDSIREIFGSGAPTNGTTGADVAGKGSRYTDVAAGTLYLNTGTTASPTWTQLAPVS